MVEFRFLIGNKINKVDMMVISEEMCKFASGIQIHYKS
jgi:hypothetical protein